MIIGKIRILRWAFSWEVDRWMSIGQLDRCPKVCIKKYLNNKRMWGEDIFVQITFQLQTTSRRNRNSVNAHYKNSVANKLESFFTHCLQGELLNVSKYQKQNTKFSHPPKTNEILYIFLPELQKSKK